jgi:hypothetical protein
MKIAITFLVLISISLCTAQIVQNNCVTSEVSGNNWNWNYTLGIGQGVYSLSFTPNGIAVVIGSSIQTISFTENSLWNYTAVNNIQTITFGTDGVGTAAFGVMDVTNDEKGRKFYRKYDHSANTDFIKLLRNVQDRVGELSIFT